MEVTRLNEFFKTESKSIALEKLEYSLIPKLRKLINNFKGAPSHTSYVGVEFARPLKVDESLFNKIKKVLEQQLACLDVEKRYNLGKLSLTFRPSTKKYEGPYRFLYSNDVDGDGMVLGGVLSSLRVIIPEKQRKILNYRNNYPIWWLALDDHIAHGIDELDFSQIVEGFDIKTFFERIIFLPVGNSPQGFDLVVPSQFHQK